MIRIVKQFLFRKNAKKIVHVSFFVAVNLILFACPELKVTRPQDPQTKSRDLLAEGLAAQNAGNESLAEDKLKNALKFDPQNERARTVLASLYAGRAGIVLTQLVDPIYQAAETLNSPAAKLLEDVRKARAEELDNKFKNDVSAEKNATVRSEAFLIEAQKVVDEISLALSQLNLAFVILNAIPIVKEKSSPELQKAIALLRNESVAPSRRSEETRVYLAILGSVQLITEARSTLGKDQFATSDFDLLQRKLCAMPAPELKKSILRVKKALELLEEGLTPSKEDPDTSKRKKRKRLQEFGTKLLGNRAFEETDVLFDKETLLGNLATELGILWCSGIKK